MYSCVLKKNAAIGPAEQFFKGGPIAAFLKNTAIGPAK